MRSPILDFFAYEHLPMRLKSVSKSIAQLAETMEKNLPPGAEKSAGLRKLLEAKDCFVRAALVTQTEMDKGSLENQLKQNREDGHTVVGK